MGRERRRAAVRPPGTGHLHAGSHEHAQKQRSLSSAAPRPHACLSTGLSWARGTAVISIQRAEGGAGSVLGSGHQTLRSCRGSRLQPRPEGALGAGQSRAFHVACGAQDRRCCCQRGPPLDFSHGEMLRLQGNQVPCTWLVEAEALGHTAHSLGRWLPVDQRPPRWFSTGSPTAQGMQTWIWSSRSRPWPVLGPSLPPYLAHL